MQLPMHWSLIVLCAKIKSLCGHSAKDYCNASTLLFRTATCSCALLCIAIVI